MQWQDLINIGVGTSFACFGWFARTLWEAVQCLKRSVHEMEVMLVGNYTKKSELVEAMNKIDARFDKMESMIGRLFDKIDNKADKHIGH